LGDKFAHDRKILEDKLLEVDGLALSDENKKLIREQINRGIYSLQEQYERDVTQLRLEVIENLQEISVRFQVGAETSGELAESIGSTQLSVAEFDSSGATVAAEGLQQDYSKQKFQNDEIITDFLDEMERQNDSVRRGFR
jgi:hypothetical protein